MKLRTPFMKPVVILVGLLLVMPVTVMAGKPDAGAKGGKPNENSVARTAACTLSDDTAARVCSCKGLSNVVLWCGGTWVKHEDFGPGEVYETTVACEDGEGNPIPGPIDFIAIKSGSQKHVKHYSGDYDLAGDERLDGAPSGSGLFVADPEACSSEFVCPAAGDCSGGDEPPGGATPDGDNPDGENPDGDNPDSDNPGDEPPDYGILG